MNKFTWTKTGVKKEGTKFASPKPVTYTYEVETTGKIVESSRISREEYETIVVFDGVETLAFTSDPSTAHKLLRDVSEGLRKGWTIKEIVTEGGSPIGVTMSAKGNRLTVRK